MKMWIQLHDFSNKEIEGATKEQAEQALSSFDWQAELSKMACADKEACPPGLGLISADGSILHICPRDEESCFVHYDYSVPSKILGVFPSVKPKSHYIENCSINTATEIISSHYEGQWEEIVKIS